MILCRITRRDAEYLMMAPALVGGWIAVSGDIVDAVERGMTASAGRDGNWAPYLALLPSDWDQVTRPVTVDQASHILAAIEHAARHPVEEDDSSAAERYADRIRAWIGGAS